VRGWTGRDVLNHMVGGADWFAGPARGEEVAFPNWSAMPARSSIRRIPDRSQPPLSGF